MKDAILLELANRWEHDSNIQPGEYEDSSAGLVTQSGDVAERETLRMCADTLRTLVKLLGKESN